MESLLPEIARHVSMAIELIAIVWLDFARWLVAGMTFQLAADVVNTSFDPSWDQIGRLAAIAGIRTLLSFFLDREMETRTEQLERERAKEAST